MTELRLNTADIPHWRIAPRHLYLAPDALHLWRIDTSEQGMNPHDAWQLLTAAQRTRIAALRYPVHQQRSIRTQAGLNRILAKYLQCAPTEVVIQRQANGKPYLDGEAAWLAFSISHSHELALVGVSSGVNAALGVDCEHMCPRTNYLAIARRMFTADQFASLQHCSESKRLEQFLYAWTALEADVKCDGRGLCRARQPHTQPPQIAHLIPAAGYLAAIARASLPPRASWQYLEYAEC